MKIVKIFAALVGLTLVFIFCSSNDTKVTLKFLEYSTPETYLFLYVLSAFVLGMISASFASTVKIMQLKRQLNKLQPEVSGAAVKETRSTDKKAKKEKKKKGKKGVEEKAEEKVEQKPAQVTPPAPPAEVSDAVYAADEEPAVENTNTVTPSDEVKEDEVAAVIELPHENVVDSADSDKQQA